MTTIALGFDDRPPAWAAVRWVVDRAGGSSDPVQVTVVVTGVPMERSEAGQGLGEALRELRATGAEVALSTDVTSRALAAASGDHDLLVAGVPRGDRPRLSGRWFPQQLIRHSPAPTCFVPEGWEPSELPVTVGVAADGSSSVAVAYAAQEAARTYRDLRLVHAASLRAAANGSLPADPQEVLEGADLMVRRVAGGVPLLLEAVPDEPATVLLAFADRSSLIVLGTHRRGFLASGIFGSVALEVIGRVACPVIIAPAAS